MNLKAHIHAYLFLILGSACAFGCGEATEDDADSSSYTEVPSDSLSKRALSQPLYWTLSVHSDALPLITQSVRLEWPSESEFALIPVEPCDHVPARWCASYKMGEGYQPLLSLGVSEHVRSPEQPDYACGGEPVVGNCGVQTYEWWYERDLFTFSARNTLISSTLNLCLSQQISQSIQATINSKQFAAYPSMAEDISLDMSLKCESERSVNLVVRLTPERFDIDADDS